MDKHKVIEIFITVDDFCKGFDEIEKGLFQLEIRNSEIEIINVSIRKDDDLHLLSFEFLYQFLKDTIMNWF
ncbi:MAG: hypothetical protein IPN87_01175 [Saprospiraceae bacterium]|nr:hypothetical protein [Candidatus Brachybacter algidus]